MSIFDDLSNIYQALLKTIQEAEKNGLISDSDIIQQLYQATYQVGQAVAWSDQSVYKFREFKEEISFPFEKWLHQCNNDPEA